MTKFRFLLFVFFLSLSAYCQFPTPGIEGFENTAGPDALPSTTWPLGTGATGNQWAVFDNSIGTGRWTINNTIPPLPQLPLVYQGVNSAYINRVQTGTTTTPLTSENYLATPRVTVPANGQIRFYTRSFTAGNTGTFYDVKLAPGASNQTLPASYTTTLATYTEDELTLDPQGIQNPFDIYTLKIINFPAAFIGQQVYVAFVRRNTQETPQIDGDRWLIDNVQLNERCLNPTTLATAGIFSGSANLTWANPSGATSWEIEILPAATTTTGVGFLYTGTLPYLATTTQYGPLPLTQTPLTPNTAYKYYVRAVCPLNIPSDWVGPFNFTTTAAPPICGGNFVDSGGTTANYANNENITTTICPINPGEKVTVTFTLFNTETTWDGLYVYNGNAVTPAALLPSANGAGNVPGGLAGSYWGNLTGANLPGPFTSTTADGCLTFVFRSDGSFNNPGWVSNITCALPPTCQQPTTLTATAITTTSAQLGWVSPGTATTWQVIALSAGSPPPTAATTGWTPAPTNPFVLGGLTPGTAYEYYVRGNCGAIDGVSLWSGPRAFSTIPTCPPQTTLTATLVTATTAQLNWTSVAPSSSWQVIALTCGSPAPTAAATGWIAAPTNPFVITGLTAATCYDFYVRGVCSPTDISFWSTSATATTQVLPPICGGNFVDAGGAAANYPNNSNSTVTICPIIPGEQVTVTFTLFNTEANWDGLYVYDGNTATPAALLPSNNPANNVPGGLPGSYWGNLTGGNLPGPFTASNLSGCLTFVFRSDGSINNPGWLANITCAPPPTCPKPTAVSVTAITQTSATINWTEMGSATQWQVLVLPSSAPTPTAATTGWVTAPTNPFVYSPLNSGTQFKVYVRSFCNANDISLWSNPVTFATLITNDECINAINVPVNPNTICTQFVGGTLIGATASTPPNTCGGTDDDDVWFSFVATTTSHSINLNNVVGSTTDLFHVLYSGNCATGLTQIYCSDPNQSTASNLIVGQTYYVRVYSFTANPNQTTTFDVCIGTIPPPISTSTSLYTTTQLVEDVLLNSTCASVTNITSSTGSNFGSTNGIGYFNQNGSSFPFNEGIILMTGNVARAPGPNTEGLSDGVAAWPGDAQLFNYIQGLGIDAGLTSYNNATKLEFDFVPLINNISFDFIFASEEYGVFQCAFSDAFAFFLTNNATGVTTNLAVLPNTTIPISVVTIRDQLYNNGCASANAQYFGNFYGAGGLDPLGAPIDFNGETVALTASSAVTPGTQYHIKLVIADRNDGLFDSAVFLKGGSFNIGTVELGNDFLEANGNALCDGTSYTILSGLNPAQYTFTWTFNGNPIPNQTGPNLVVTQEGIYGISATYIGTTCSATDTITIEFYDAVASGTPNTMTICNSSGFAQFNLSQNNASSLGGLDGTLYTVVYYVTNADALAEANPLPNLYTNTTQFLQTIYVRVENILTGCFTVKPFNLVVQDLTPLFTITPNFSICSGTSQTITVTPINYNNSDVIYSWTLDGNPIQGATNQITVTQAGTYIVTVNNSGCLNTGQTVVTVIPIPVPDAPANVTACNSYTLPTLTVGNYYTQPLGGGTLLPANSVITSNQTLYVFAQSGTVPNCTAENSFTITINPQVTPQFTQIPTICLNATAPSLPTASNNGGITGTWNPPTINTSAVGTTTYTFTPDAGFCATTGTMSITINAFTTATFTQIAPICQGGNAPALPTASTNTTAITGTWNPSTISTANAGSTTYTFTPNSGQCAAGTTMQITIHPTPVVIPIGDIDACNSFTLPALSVGNYFAQPNGVAPITNLTLTSSQLVYVYAQSNTTPNCTDQDSFQVNITPSPQFTINGECVGSVFTLSVINASFNLDSASYNWSGPSVQNNGEPTLQISEPGIYTCTVSVSNGNEFSCSTTQTFNANDIGCQIPKGISPNGDTLNDSFDLTGFNVEKLSIFNRYGTAVYSKTNYINEWAGQSDSGNELSDGTYYYVIELKNGGETRTGWVYINREVR